jgi:hypothetical protein
MNIRFILVFIIPILLTTGCRSFGYTEKPNKDFLLLLNKQSSNTDILQLNGLYSLVEFKGLTNQCSEGVNFDEDIFTDPLFFYGNNIYKNIGGLYSYTREGQKNIFLDSKDHLLNQAAWGVYVIRDSTIYAISYSYFVGTSSIWNNRLLCYFVGKIKSKQRIEDWHMIPPFPNLTRKQSEFKANKLKMIYLTTKKTFVFQKFPIKTSLDSNKVWVNKYKTKN